ncbi:MAG: cytochrome c [Alphaproteobacteria bacterium]|nr:cytochrome c [Alphaproteobacteria bacterium]
MRWKMITAVLATCVLIGLVWWWITLPRTPEELYKARCAACHKLSDLSGYKKDEIEGIVRTMRTRNGADKVIDDEEAIIITRYLEGLRE